jgi:hypothetical protein
VDRESRSGPEHALGREVEGRRQDLLDRDRIRLDRETGPFLQEIELPAGRERGARHHDGLQPVEQRLAKDRGEVQGHRVESHVLVSRIGALDPPDRRRSLRCRLQRLGEPFGRHLDAAKYRADLGEEREPFLGEVVAAQSVGDDLDCVPQAAKREQRVVQRGAKPLLPHRIVRNESSIRSTPP